MASIILSALATSLWLPRVLGQTQYFKIESLTASNCYAIDHDQITGDDRGGIAISSTSVFYTGEGNPPNPNPGGGTKGLFS